MPGRCCVSGCPNESGGSKNPSRPKKVHLYKFPLKNESLLKTWLHNIRHPGWVPKQSSRICSLHFTGDDFKKKRSDKNVLRRLKRNTLVNCCLEPDAVPTVFKGVPKSLLKVPPKKRSEVASTEERQQTKAAWAQLNRLKFQQADRLKSLDDLVQRLDSGGLPELWTQMRVEDTLLLNLVEVSAHKIPCIAASIAIDSKLVFTLSFHGRTLERVKFCGLTPGQKIRQFSQVIDLLAEVKQWALGRQRNQWLKMAKECLENFLSEEGLESDQSLSQRVGFIQQQLQVHSQLGSKPFRPYPQDLMLFAYCFYTTYPQEYRILLEYDLVSLPCQATLRHLIRKVGIKELDNKCKRGVEDEEEEDLLMPALFDDCI